MLWRLIDQCLHQLLVDKRGKAQQFAGFGDIFDNRVQLPSLHTTHPIQVAVVVLLSTGFHKHDLLQWFPTGEEFLPREEFHEFRGGISTFYLSYLFVVQ